MLGIVSAARRALAPPRTYGTWRKLSSQREQTSKGKPLASEVKLVTLLVAATVTAIVNDKSSASLSPIDVLTSYLLQTGQPPWTSYFVKYADVVDDQRGMSHFNWPVASSNYHVLRTGCFPYVKYHCSKRARQDLSTEDKFFKAIKIANLGIPTLLYGLAATLLIRHQEIVKTARGDVTIYFLLPEDKGSIY